MGVRGGVGGYFIHSYVHLTAVNCFLPCARNCARVLQQQTRQDSLMVFLRVFESDAKVEVIVYVLSFLLCMCVYLVYIVKV